MGCGSDILLQSSILLRKNFKIYSRHYCDTLFLICMPSVIVALLVLLSYGIDRTDPAIRHPAAVSSLLPRCSTEGHSPYCMDLVVAPSDNFARNLLLDIAREFGDGRTVGPAGRGVDLGLVSANSSAEFNAWFLAHQNMSLAGVFFETPTNYTLFFNATFDSPFLMVSRRH